MPKTKTMTLEQLTDVMMFQLKNFNRTGKEITKETVLNTILRTDDGYKRVTSASLFKNFVRFSIIQSGVEDKKWPSKWIELSVTELAKQLLTVKEI